MREKGNSLHGELVGGTEDADGNLASISHHDLLKDVIGLAGSRATDRVDRVFLLVNHGLEMDLCSCCKKSRGAKERVAK